VEWITQAIDLFLHLDRHLAAIIGQYGTWTYAILVLIVFCETGLVVTPFLPGDSLLFAAGSLAALGAGLDPLLLFLLLSAAAIAGDTVNYWVGDWLGQGVTEGRYRFIRQDYLHRTHQFYEKHGGKTILLARFIPIIRTFAPFVAGVGTMTYPRFLAYNVIGGVAWVGLFVWAGYFFGNLPVVKENFSMVILAIIALSVLPIAVEVLRAWREGRREREGRV
jgi:membrane-associated protein